MSNYTWMRTPQQALDEIAQLIHIQASCAEQDRWLKAAIELGYVQVGEEE
jgi:hypothetical protein